MAFATFVFFQAFNLLNVRNETRSVFTRETLGNPSAFVAPVVVLLGLVVEMDMLHGVFTTTDLTSGQWLVCAAIGPVILWVGELCVANSGDGTLSTIAVTATSMTPQYTFAPIDNLDARRIAATGRRVARRQVHLRDDRQRLESGQPCGSRRGRGRPDQARRA
jgi:hypothetical protein